MNGLSQTAPVIHLQAVSFTYEGSHDPALTNISLQVNPGQWVSIVGPSGSGKTTLCGVMSGVLQQMSSGIEGQVMLFGTPLTMDGLPRERLGQVGLVFQDPDSGLVHAYVEDELSFAPENLRICPELIKQRMTDSLDAVGLPQMMMYRKTNELSGGQKQRVAVASMLTMYPTLLMMDESANHLDQDGTSRLYETIRSLHEAGHTVVTTSSRWEDRANADHVIVLDQGDVVISGHPIRVREQHREQLQQLGIIPEMDAKDAVLHAVTQVEKPPNVQGEPILNVDDLSFTYEHSKQPVFEKLTFQLYERSFLAVLGANGTGKTTLGRLIAGLLPCDQGKITICGRTLHSIPSQRLARLVGYLFQNPDHQFVASTVWAECKFGNHGDAEVTRMLKQYKLSDEQQTNPYQLNLFQKRKLNLLTAHLSQPKLIVLDEPTAGLNYTEADELISHCAHIAEQGAAVVVITHDTRIVEDQVTDVLRL